ncbi:MAG: GNAT family N-acetyltransferase [candidate division WOR-3 bacterium]|nr:MAG: GNAT family N-acetyltransferase [candidate division WOR-3 bacterium]
MNAWPALETILYDGWVLRFANGYTRRANSVNPVYASSIDLNTKISYCEGMYTQKGLRTIFKMTRDVFPPDLDSVLENKGYAREAETSVQILMLDSFKSEADERVDISDRMDDAWLDAFFRMSGTDVKYRDTLSSILTRGPMERCLAQIERSGKIIACGVGAREDTTVGLFEIIVDQQLRGMGLGRLITESMLAWAKKAGADTSYLQVMVDNRMALALYKKLGFMEEYRYWYRVNRPRK